jgi:hypothetical protein
MMMYEQTLGETERERKNKEKNKTRKDVVDASFSLLSCAIELRRYTRRIVVVVVASISRLSISSL